MIGRILRRIFVGGSGGRDPGIGLFLLAYQLLAQVGLNRIRPVTGAAIAVQVAVFLGWIRLGWNDSDVCLSANAILGGDYRRLWTAPLTHATDIHLYYNMLSLAWKGLKLEAYHGSLKFLFLLNLFSIMSGVIYVILSVLVADVLEDSSYLSQCAVGFSAVLFALKVQMHQIEYQSWEDFGFFAVPKHLAIWTELFLIQILVPNASFVGHLAGILTGLIYVNAHLPLKVISAPFKTSMPATTTLALTAFAFQYDLINKPWTTRMFWSSKSSLVCLNSKFVIAKGQWTRLLSAPLEHHGTIHFLLCVASFLLKGRFLEEKRSFFRMTAMTIAALIATSTVYITLAQLAEDVFNYENASECVQGLSGLNFALKVVVFYEWIKDGKRSNLPHIMFEIAESFILVESKTSLYHFSGILVGIFACTFSFSKFLTSRFPGRGHRLGGAPGTCITRSWGYAGKENRFVDSRTRKADAGATQASASTSVADETQQDSESDSLSYEKTPPRPSAPPAPTYFSDLTNPPPPPPTGGTTLSDEESQGDSDPSVQDQIDRSPSNPQFIVQ